MRVVQIGSNRIGEDPEWMVLFDTICEKRIKNLTKEQLAFLLSGSKRSGGTFKFIRFLIRTGCLVADGSKGRTVTYMKDMSAVERVIRTCRATFNSCRRFVKIWELEP